MAVLRFIFDLIVDYFWDVVKGVLIASGVGLFLATTNQVGAFSTILTPELQQIADRVFYKIGIISLIGSVASLCTYGVRWSWEKLKELLSNFWYPR